MSLAKCEKNEQWKAQWKAQKVVDKAAHTIHVHQMLSPMSDNETSDKCKHSKSTIIDENDMPTSGSKRMSDYHLPSPLHK
ncbi:hypothetical protein RhiirA1_467604 [Rhizophagus irregularis]|uniref:Uncharacterized protein n=1 Tax=Rhizophagus irregularis TaxID=588596 RepID=A0A2N0RBR4_9GLOM|nr:hypothetical protein RhiirA1_467604 [Rhizophagus irregularis]GET57825.1 hypothetical protein RIR_jg41800.t1 [Rhizophagus irregularis DAOM 181602=DAOM 197198]CAG8578012.1 13958_t:CDS:2 [Rhizophagus irregularis]